METWVKALEDGYTIWDIGQLPPKVKAMFRRMARRKEIYEGKGHWHNTSSLRSYWRKVP